MTIQTLVSDFAALIEAHVRAEVEARLRAALTGAFGKRGPGRPPKAATVLAAKPAKHKPVSAARAKTMKTQGIYLGLIRHLSGAERAEVKAVAKEKGVAAAVAFGKKFKK